MTPDFSGTQFYLASAPGGFGVAGLRDMPGGRGEGVRILDIQYSWNINHEDLPFDDERRPFVYERGVDPFPADQGSHGTACIGMLLGVENGFGITGICPDAEIGLINPVDNNSDYKLAAAIDSATSLLERGDIMHIQQQARGINREIAALPPEWEPAVFDAVQRAVAKGIVVIEPAGNGGAQGKQGEGREPRQPGARRSLRSEEARLRSNHRWGRRSARRVQGADVELRLAARRAGLRPLRDDAWLQRPVWSRGPTPLLHGDIQRHFLGGTVRDGRGGDRPGNPQGGRTRAVRLTVDALGSRRHRLAGWLDEDAARRAATECQPRAPVFS